MPTRQVFLSLNCSLNSRTSPSSILRLRPNKPECWYFWLNHEVINTDLFCYLNWNKTLKLILPPSAVCLPTLFAHHHCVPAKLCALCAIEQWLVSSMPFRFSFHLPVLFYNKYISQANMLKFSWPIHFQIISPTFQIFLIRSVT